MSRDGCVALPRGAMGLSAVCDALFPDHKITISRHCLVENKDPFLYISPLLNALSTVKCQNMSLFSGSDVHAQNTVHV